MNEMNINMSHELIRSRQSSEDIGDWNANVLTEVGTQTGNKKKLDYDGLGAINPSTKSFTFGAEGWNPVIGDWNGNGVWDEAAKKELCVWVTGMDTLYSQS